MAFNIFATATSDIPLANLDANFTMIGSSAVASTLYPTASTSITYGTAGTSHIFSGSIGAFTLAGTVAGGGNQLNNVIIGTTTPLAGAFTTLSATKATTGDVITFTNSAASNKTGYLFSDATYIALGTTAAAAAGDKILFSVGSYALVNGTSHVYNTVGNTIIGDFSSTGLAVTGTLTSTLDATHYGVTVGRGGGAVSTNTAVGASALTTNSTGSFNTALGNGSLGSNTTASNNTAVGYQAGYLSTGAGNQCFGYSSGSAITSGAKNVIVGSYTGSAAPISATGSNFVVLSDGDGNIVASSKTAQTFALQGGTLSTGTGIAFPATQSASTDANTLDDYEEGTWNPNFVSLTVVNGTGGATYSGTYTKIGRLVFWTATISVTGTCTTASVAGTTNISNLPFQVLGSNSFLTACDGTPNSLGVGQNQGGSLVAYIPTWTARNSAIFLSGQFNY